MSKRWSNKAFAIGLIVLMLFWSALPSIAMATFITPGKPITPGTAITPGEPIQGGSFIVPGEPIVPGKSIDPGTPVQGGQAVSGGGPQVSGQPIIPGNYLTNGLFVVPNYLGGTTYGKWLIAGQPISPGAEIAGGEAIQGGQGIAGGQQSTGGNTSETGKLPTGEIPAGGDIGQGGKVPVAGDGSQVGQVPSGGSAIKGAPNSGGGTSNSPTQNPTGSNGNSSQTINGIPSGSSGGGAGAGGIDGGGGGAGASSGNESANSASDYQFSFFKFTNPDNSPMQTVFSGISDFKTYILGAGKKIAEGATATYAGFRFNPKDTGKYGVSGKGSLKNPIADYFYQSYKDFKIDGEAAKFGPHSRHVGQSRVDSFLSSKNIANSTGSTSGFFKSSLSGVKPALNDGYNVFSKSFWSKSNMLKLSGPVGVGLSSVSSIYDYGFGGGEKQALGFASTDFAADLTTDIAIGAGTTVLSTIASSMAAGAVAGSVVPGVGTIVGAVAGVATGLVVGYLINGTATGRRIKGAVRDGIKAGYDGVVSAAKWAGKGLSNAFSGAKSLFGF